MASLTRGSKIADLEDLIGYSFRNPNIAWEALHAAGSPLGGTTDGNKRLAMVGDADIRSLVVKEMYQTGQSRAQTQATIERVVSNNHLGQIGGDLNIAALIKQNPAQRTVSNMTMAHTMEAIVGAVSVDSNGSLDALRLVLQNLGLWPEE